MRIIICAILFLIFGSFNFAYSSQIDVPVPNDAVKIMDKEVNIGPSKSTVESYETSLSRERVSAFYKKEMARAGWREMKKGIFSKENYMVVIAALPKKTKDNKMQFSVTTSKIPTKEEILAQRKAKPDKLDFMPVYPGSEQVFLWDMPTGLSASYETKSDIKDVVFFYKSGMLNYGWSLTSETPLTTEAIDCPECQKKAIAAGLPKEAAAQGLQGTSGKAGLTFRKGDGESCIIKLYQTAAFDTNKTAILVTYNANKRINP